MCLYIGISYLLFGVVETKAQIANTALSITLHPFLSVSVNPVSSMEFDDNKVEKRAHMTYSYHQSFTHVEIGSNEAFEVQVKHIDFLDRPSAIIPLQPLSNLDIIRVDTFQNMRVNVLGLEMQTALEIANKECYSATTGILRYTITAL
ncbi:hypothetical protein [Sphingobacterium faecium]|uniref:hypothetical protein n=1 Tax=Sphingobacterium faecium TaxID=34087 RepID=UPI00320AE341